LIIQGANSEQEVDIHPPSLADYYAALLTHVPGGVKMLRLENTSHCPNLPRRTAPVVNRALAQFLAGVPGEAQPPLIDPSESMTARFKRALEYLSELTGRPEIGNRNPTSVFSFSNTTEEERAYRILQVIGPCLRSNNNWTPVNPDGSLPRRFSERSLGIVHPGARKDSVVEMVEEIYHD